MTDLTIPHEYVVARSVLLDALTALRAHLDAMVLVGAQAVYSHTGDADMVTAPTTTDADVALAPDRLADEPLLEEALRLAGFVSGTNPGTWRGQGAVAIDLMVPAAVSGPRRSRGARLPVHGKWVARRTLGLEPALVDNETREIQSFSPGDSRRARLRVAGPAALLVAKTIKIEERRADHDSRRLQPKDGLDVLRLLRVIDMGEVARRLHLLAMDDVAGEVTRSALVALREHGARADGPIATLAASAVTGTEDPDVTIESTVLLVEELLQACDDQR
ncbi:hypothetical protein [Saccharopolyspora cebuensis]|uniref:Nucleotidyltransferase n=1 Tax=Saccharopolyspora cebuensis TaxID=418759 RepID=A0ABV4CDZ6_9PSEU